MSNTLKIYLDRRVNELMESARTFEKRVMEDHQELMRIQKLVHELKKSNPKAEYSEVRSELQKLQELSQVYLKEQQLKIAVNGIKEYLTMADMLNVEISFDDAEFEMIAKEIRKVDNELYAIDSNKQIVYKNQDHKEQIESAMKQRMNDENGLKEMFKMIP